ncbi:unnamed protein product, partial [Didymodactylos carnosus]
PAWSITYNPLDSEQKAFNNFVGFPRQTHGLKQQYETDLTFSDNIHKIPALAFLEPDSVIDGFETLCARLDDTYQDILDYMEDTYIGRIRGAIRRQPLFNIDFWNIRNRVLNNTHKTNNNVEAWHQKMNSAFLRNHPNLWTFLEKLIKQENILHTDIIKAKSGQAPTISKQYISVHKRLHNLVENPPPSVYEQLEAIGRLISL